MPRGERLGAVDAMQEAWTGEPVANLAPSILAFAAKGPVGELAPGQQIPFELRWKCDRSALVSVDIRTESLATQSGGDSEPEPEILPSIQWEETSDGLDVKAPMHPGNYRIFIYVTTDDQSVATANIPILVRPIRESAALRTRKN